MSHDAYEAFAGASGGHDVVVGIHVSLLSELLDKTNMDRDRREAIIAMVVAQIRSEAEQ